ncbi:MAG: NAD(P)H-dependent oxidoreductase [Gammaproteobacteria bacterium]|nr:NAD(P)H-dependent oxidoreductase [Gammaproteobacteria bacterium]
MISDKQLTKTPLQVLRIDASARYEGSVTRRLADDFIKELQRNYGGIQIQFRDLARDKLPFIDDAWIGANFTKPEQRTAQQKQILAQSDSLVKQVQDADMLVFAVPIYNFSVPATLKAWIDLVARAGLTFRYTADGPVGLLENKKALLILASGGTPIGSDIDYASGYLRHVLGFLGIHDVELISAGRLNIENTDSMHSAQQQIGEAVEKLQQALRAAA